ncbi:MAG: 1-acyl-sn-glycerol-3-phosphate acyltransferase [Saprospiraceae bacterium]|nr:1-acyl-sn-glycerol-3-phosphate acyltransferase [Saprospiraceae bacterium]
MKEKTKIYPHVIPEIRDWPIYKLHENRKEFIDEIVAFTLERMTVHPVSELSDIIAKTIYLERIRIKEEPWKVDPPNEKQFWRRIKKKLVKKSLDNTDQAAASNNEEILRIIIRRYAEEIVGTFRKKTFLFARRFLTFFFKSLLNTLAHPRRWKLGGGKRRLGSRLLLKGKVDSVRGLMKKGTVVIVPTHFSNLDSILIGYAMDTFAGLPSFAYGAGLNLYNTGYTAYFMNRLGAYRVDRRKKNSVYLETLKAMSNLAIQRGTNSLFFPGGTRSRSGALESKLKLGLLSTVIEAQRASYQKGEDKKIFIVPLILSYHTVLEAQFLIEQYLRRMGKERYIKKSRDQFTSFRKIVKFAWQVFFQGNDITLSFGQPMDVLGNPVDDDGNSHDQYGKRIEVKEYFVSSGDVKKDLQRESQYTKLLAEAIVDRYHRDNIVLASHLIAYAAFKYLAYQNRKLDLFGILRLPTEDFDFPHDTLERIVEDLRTELTEMEAKEQIKLSTKVRSLSPAELVEEGVRRLGIYHVAKPLRYDKHKQIVSDSFKLLYYYHNRLDNYQLEEKVHWKERTLETV